MVYVRLITRHITFLVVLLLPLAVVQIGASLFSAAAFDIFLQSCEGVMDTAHITPQNNSVRDMRRLLRRQYWKWEETAFLEQLHDAVDLPATRRSPLRYPKFCSPPARVKERSAGYVLSLERWQELKDKKELLYNRLSERQARAEVEMQRFAGKTPMDIEGIIFGDKILDLLTWNSLEEEWDCAAEEEDVRRITEQDANTWSPCRASDGMLHEYNEALMQAKRRRTGRRWPMK